MEVLGEKHGTFRIPSIMCIPGGSLNGGTLTICSMLTVRVLCQDGVASEYWLGLTLLVDGGDFKLVEVAWFQALGSGAAAARLRKGNISNSRKYHGVQFKKDVVVRTMRQI